MELQGQARACRPRPQVCTGHNPSPHGPPSQLQGEAIGERQLRHARSIPAGLVFPCGYQYKKVDCARAALVHV